jgi:hypothetical protein
MAARFVAADLEVDAVLVHDLLRFGEHVDQMRHRRALIAADIGDARLERRLGDGEDALALENLALPQLEGLHFLGKRPFGHSPLAPTHGKAPVSRPIRFAAAGTGRYNVDSGPNAPFCKVKGRMPHRRRAGLRQRDEANAGSG